MPLTSWHLDDKKCLLLTVAVALSLIVFPFIPDGNYLSAAMMLFYTSAMAGAPLAINRHGKLNYMKYLITAWIFLFLAQLFGMIFFPAQTLLADGIRTVIDIINLSFELFLVMCVLYYSVKSLSRKEPIFGCILSYMLLGTFFGNVYYFMLERMPGSFEAASLEKLGHGDMIYLSFITLSTCGFGDIVPKSMLAKMIVSLETVCGVMYVALFIGRIVSCKKHENANQENE